jgi:hypoxanthine phosphoribosyltransferase
VLFAEAEIARKVEALAAEIAALGPEIATPVLIGSFIFAADLMRALARRDLSLPAEFLWLRSYQGRQAREMEVLAGPSAAVKGKSVLLIDGVLDHGTTIARARSLLKEAGARSVLTAVAVDKLRPDAVVQADFALFHGVDEFIVGYGMDQDGRDRGLPDIRTA